MQFSLPSLDIDAAFVLTVLDNQGKSHYLHNNSACGTWVGLKPDGSMVIGAAYDGCYVREKDGAYVMTITLEEVLNGEVQHHRKDLKCPILPAMDSPSPDVCAAIKREDRLSCANPRVAKDLCEGLGCCFSPRDSAMPCYYGNKLTAQCTADNHVLVAIYKDMTTPSLILDSVNLLTVNPASCPELSVSNNNAFIVFRFPLSCGSSFQMDGDKMVYENRFEATKDVVTWQGTSITRDSTMRLTIRCGYARSGIVPLQVEVFTLPPPLPVSTYGPLLLEMRIARDQQYASYFSEGDYPVVKLLREPVYLEVRILQRTDASLVLILHECWATSSEATQQPQWPILVNRCPFTGDNYLTQLIPAGAASLNVPFPSHYQRFSINTFTFVDERSQLSLGGLVYFHCSASVCVPSTSESCRTNCARRKKRVAEMWVVEEHMENIVTSDGPVDFIAEQDEQTRTMKGDLGACSSPLLDWARGVAAAGGVLAVILVVMALWNCHRNQNPKMYTVKA
ncbi:zona pellucida sperm-binding protein 4-like [Ascaphus truei]|uniref:zona pellucida sperm-binding protein 4-like n=1 Tax=Ascaphus truei TaxID=8439 RepID=UPI003F5926C5